MISGRCECGAVRFSVAHIRETVTACHCSQCRRLSGHVWASTEAPDGSLHFETDAGLTWYASSDFAKRGFCQRCGSNLFWKRLDEDTISIAAGCLDLPTGLTLTKHIFTANKGDYYEIIDGLPQN